jgi:hypothetical protein
LLCVNKYSGCPRQQLLLRTTGILSF